MISRAPEFGIADNASSLAAAWALPHRVTERPGCRWRRRPLHRLSNSAGPWLSLPFAVSSTLRERGNSSAAPPRPAYLYDDRPLLAQASAAVDPASAPPVASPMDPQPHNGQDLSGLANQSINDDQTLDLRVLSRTG